MMRRGSCITGEGLMSLLRALVVVVLTFCTFPSVAGVETNYIRRRLAVEHIETHVPIRSTKRVEGAMIIDEKKYREGSAKSPQRHKLQHAKDFSASLFGNATLDHYLVPPAGKDYRRDEDPSAFRVREWPAVFTLNCPDVKVFLPFLVLANTLQSSKLSGITVEHHTLRCYYAHVTLYHVQHHSTFFSPHHRFLSCHPLVRKGKPATP